MNKRFNMVIVIFLTIILANITPFIVQSADASEGICGENLTWVLDDTGTLYIKGEGKSEIYENAGDEPWYDYRN